MKRKFFISIFILSLALVLITGCSTESNKVPPDNGKLKIITTLFPQYDFIREIGKDKVDVKLLLPAGVEAHAYEPTPRDIANIKNADMFIYTGEYMEPWAVKIADNIKSEKLVMVDASQGINLMGDSHDEHDHDDNHDHGDKDPHIWLDPIYAQKMVDNIVAGLIEVDRENERFYVKNGEDYKTKLEELDQKFVEAFQKTKSNNIIYGGHFAFGYFTKRYNLKHISPYSGFTPDTEPTPKRIIELIKTIESAGVKAIYYEELIDPKVAKILSKETDARMLLLHGAHNLSKDELESNLSYIDIMEGNLERLKEGLGYNE